MGKRQNGRKAKSTRLGTTISGAPIALPRGIRGEVDELEAIATALEMMAESVVQLDRKGTAAVYFLAVQAGKRIKILGDAVEEAILHG